MICVSPVSQNTDTWASTNKRVARLRGSQLSVSFTAISQVSVESFQLCNTQLSVEQALDCDSVKQLILKGYELVPEAYRQKFRNQEKGISETYVEFARTKEQLFDRWCSSQEIDNNYDRLRQLI